MSHDDDGRFAPKLAPHQVVIVPLTGRADNPEAISEYAENLAAALRGQTYDGEPVRVHVDDKDRQAGEKMWGWTKKGVPILVEIGTRELEGQSVWCATALWARKRLCRRTV